MAQTTDNQRTQKLKGAGQRRILYTQIEKLERDIRIGQELIQVEAKRLAQKSHLKAAAFENSLKKTLFKEELALQPAPAARDVWLAEQLPKLEEEQRLQYRKLRQDLRRSENLLDQKGRLKDSDAQLSATSKKKLGELLAEQSKQRDALSQSLLKKAQDSRLDKAALASRQAAFDKAQADKVNRVKTLKAQLAKKDAEHMAAFTKKQEARNQVLRNKLTGKQARLHESALGAQYDLPQDVCLRLDNVSMVFGGLRAVDQLSFDVKKGEIFGLIGPNGAGKTTVFNCITQFYKPTQGDIIYRTHEGNVLLLNYYQVHDIITKGIVRTFQNVEVIGELSILENLLIAAHQEYTAGFFSQMLNTRKVRREEEVMRERALKALHYCGLTAIKDLPPVGQPYGTLKRIELARTLMAGANLIILDEPAAGLNDQETIELTHLIRKIQKDYDVTIFLVEHNMGLVMDLCDHICAISFGKKLAIGTPQEIQSNPVVQEAYLGTDDTEEIIAHTEVV